MKPNVYVTRRIPQPGLDILAQHVNITMNPEDRVLTPEELRTAVRGCDALLCLLTDAIDAEVMDAAGSGLKVIANYAVGFNNIAISAASSRGIPVTNTPGVLTETTADLAFTLLMAAARRIVESDRFTRAGKFDGWGPMLFLGQDIHHKTIGIVGFGRIGQAVAQRARGFDMKVLYHDAQRAPEAVERQYQAEFRPLDDLLRESDFISLHVPLLDSTRHLICEEQFNLMKPTAILINTARGPVVNEKALVQALKNKRIAGAALDVFEREPVLEPGLIELDNVTIVPHIASGSVETRTKMAVMTAENILAALNGQIPPNIVNSEVWEKRRK